MLRLCTLGLSLMLGGAALADTTIKTAQGPVSFDSTPKIVAAYDVAAIDTLTALGVPPQGVIEKLYVSYLDDVAAKAAKVGTIHEPDLEALNALGADLAIIGGRSARKLKDAQRVTNAIDMTISDKVIEVGFERLEDYGKLFGKEEKAAELKAGLEARFAKTSKALEGQGKALVIMTNGTKVSAFGAKGRFGWLYKRFGLTPAGDVEASGHGEAISFEYIRQVNPDILFVIDRQFAVGGDGPQAVAVLDNALMHETKAWTNDKVIYLDAAAAYIAGGGVMAIGLVLDSIDAALAKN